MRAGLLPAAAALVLACTPAGSGAASPTKGGEATDFSARDLEGRTFRLGEHLGRHAVLLDFWATWCQPCQAEFPHLQRLYTENRERGFVVVAIAMDGPETIAEVPSFVRRNNLTFPVVLDEDSRIAALYNPRKAAPLSILIDKTGRIVKVREGFNPGDDALLEADVRAVLAETAPTP